MEGIGERCCPTSTDMKIPNKKVIAKRLKELPTGRFQYRCKINGETKKYSPETTDKLAAADRVKIWLEEISAGNFAVVSKIEKKAEKVVMTILQILSIFDKLHSVKENTAKGYKCCLGIFCRENNISLSSPASKLTKKLAEAWLKKRKGNDDDEEEQQRREDRAASILRQARSVFSADMLEHYELPESFSFAKVKPPAAQLKGFKPATDGRYARAWDYFYGIADSDPQLFIAFKLMAEYGLRNSEAGRSKQHWLAESCLSVEISKTKGVRQLPYQSEEDRELFLNHNPDGDFILQSHKTERRTDVWRRLNAQLKKLGFTGTKKAYELRKYFGSQVAQQTKSVWLAAEMLGNTPEVAKASYVGLLKMPEYNIRKAVA
tara:strand:- start:346 stop:1473 length:1128 start_codon:yes stop_codon:yes gene_type:complete